MKQILHTTGKIVIFGKDPCLMETRKWVLERVGYATLTVDTFPGLEEMAEDRSIDLFLLCDSLHHRARADALAMLHTVCPATRRLVLAATSSALELQAAEHVFISVQGPYKLIETIQAMMSHHSALPSALHSSIAS